MEKDILDQNTDNIIKALLEHAERLHEQHGDEAISILLNDIRNGDSVATASLAVLLRIAFEETKEMLDNLAMQIMNVGSVVDIVQQALVNTGTLSYDDLAFSAKQYEYLTDMKDDLIERVQKGEIKAEDIEEEMRKLVDKARKMAELALGKVDTDNNEAKQVVNDVN